MRQKNVFKSKTMADDSKSIVSDNMYATLTPPVPVDPPTNNILRIGYFRKLRSLRKKFFIIYKDMPNQPACLVCYDSEKKWKSGLPPKQSIIVRNCFNINRYAKHANTIALYMGDEILYVTLDSKEMMEDWLRTLLRLQQGDLFLENENWVPKPIFEQIWKVKLLNKCMGQGPCYFLGDYYLCLTETEISLLKISESEESPFDSFGNTCSSKDLSLNSLSTDINYHSFYSYSFHHSPNRPMKFPFNGIRKCGSIDNYVFLETGRSTVLGAGELWMEVEDSFLANNITLVIMDTMKNDNNVIIEEEGHYDTKKRNDFPADRDGSNRSFNILDISQKKLESEKSEESSVHQRNRANSESTSSFYGVLNRFFHSLKKSNSSSQNDTSETRTPIESTDSIDERHATVSGDLVSERLAPSNSEGGVLADNSLEEDHSLSRFQMTNDVCCCEESEKSYMCSNSKLQTCPDENHEYVNLSGNCCPIFGASSAHQVETRPMRAYSLGSKPIMKNFDFAKLMNANNAARSRTSSVNSKLFSFERSSSGASSAAKCAVAAGTPLTAAVPIGAPISGAAATIAHKMDDLIEVDCFGSHERAGADAERDADVDVALEAGVDADTDCDCDCDCDRTIGSSINISEIPYIDMEQDKQSVCPAASPVLNRSMASTSAACCASSLTMNSNSTVASSCANTARNSIKFQNDYVNIPATTERMANMTVSAKPSTCCNDDNQSASGFSGAECAECAKQACNESQYINVPACCHSSAGSSPSLGPSLSSSPQEQSAVEVASAVIAAATASSSSQSSLAFRKKFHLDYRLSDFIFKHATFKSASTAPASSSGA